MSHLKSDLPPDATYTFAPTVALDLAATVFPLQRGSGDPVSQIRSEGFWRTVRNHAAPDQLATILFHTPASTTQPSPLRVSVWTNGYPAFADQLIAHAPEFLGINDDAVAGWQSFDELLGSTQHLLPPSIIRARKDNPGLRFTATGQLLEQLFTVILEQKVTHDQARAGWRWLVRNFGTAAPGPLPHLMAAPAADQVAQIPSWQWHKGWVQPQLAKTMLRVAERGSAVERLGRNTRNSPSDIEGLKNLGDRLQSIPGIGPWTIAETLQRSHGSTDLVSVGDYHLAHHVGETLTGQRVSDAKMLEILEPWRGHRQRIVRLIMSSGMKFSRFGPKLAPTDFRDR